MKTFTFVMTLLCLFFTANAAGTPPDLRGTKNYFFSSLSGNDSRTPAQAQDSSTPWKSIQKLNSIMNILQPGDAVLFKRGEVFDGAIVVAQSGINGASIIFSAYGTGSKPVINGLATFKTWTSSGNGTWETSLSSGSYLNMVLVNGVVQPMGRFPNASLPNKGFLTLESHSGSSQLTDNELDASTNWTGAEVVVRKNDWTLDRAPITAHNGNTLYFTSPSAHEPINGYGYFIQNSPLTLDQTGEWYYNPSTKKLRMYFGTANPKDFSIKASKVDTLVFLNNNRYILFDNLSFRGGDVAAFQLNNSSNIIIQNDDINYTGLDGISAVNTPFMDIENNIINHSNNSGIRLYQGSSYAIIKNNKIKNSGIIPGMGSSNNQQHDGIFVDATPSNTIELNVVDSSGYCGITFTGDSITVKNNFVNHFCLTVNDGGGIYTWGGWDKVGRIVTGNIVINGIGAPAGTNSTNPNGAVGIYTDDRSTNIDITKNTIANCVRAGIYLHNSHEMNIISNTFYNNGTQLSLVHDALEPGDPIRNINTNGNVISSSLPGNLLLENASTLDDMSNFGSFNYNYYIRPTADNGIISTNVLDNGQYNSNYYDLSSWTTTYGYDKQSANSPIKIPAYVVNRLVGANKYPNGNFNSNVDGVSCLSSPGRGTASFNSSGKLDGGCLQVSFDSSGGSANDVGSYFDIGAVTAGKTYLIKFSLLGTYARKTMKCTILQNGGTYNKLSSINYFDLTTTRTENQFIFTAPSTESSAVMVLETGGTDCPFWFDNLAVYEADITLVNANDYMRFEYNATATTKSVKLNGTYVDPTQKQYTGTVTIAPFSSIILLKQPPAPSASQTAVQTSLTQLEKTETSLLEATAMSVKVSPNPVHEKMQVSLNLAPNTKNASMTIYSLAGVTVKTIALSGTANTVPVDVSSLNSGVYIINIVCDGHVTTKKFVKQ